MGVGGHKHHFNDSRIEKEMESIGDAVCYSMLIVIDKNFSFILKGSINKIERTLQRRTRMFSFKTSFRRMYPKSQ